jgi:hypothetical protein
MFTKEIIGNEFYLFYNGRLIYNRWLNRNVSRIFQCYAIYEY